MKIESIQKFGLPEKIVEIFRRNGVKELLRIQQMAINSGKLFDSDLLVLAPTSSGKTFCGELSAIAAAVSGKRAVFLTSLRSIAVEKYEEFRKKYAAFGIRIVLSTQDYRDDDENIVKGNYDIAIVIYEKFNRFLTRNINMLSATKTLIFDEIDLFGDNVRGEVVRLILAKVSKSLNEAQIIGLGREDFGFEGIPVFESFNIIKDNIRPIDLRKGVLHGNRFEYSDYNSFSTGNERLFESYSEEEFSESALSPRMCHTLSKLGMQGEQTIVFLKTKFATVNAALELSSVIQFPPAKDTIEHLSELEETSLARNLMICLESGIAFHNADLNEDEGWIIVDGFRAGEIRLLFSTTTLSAGVNLPAKNVFIEPVQFIREVTDFRPAEVPMSYSAVDTIAGRAGRWGAGENFGRAILIASSEFEKEALWSRYIENNNHEFRFKTLSLSSEAVLDMIASGLYNTAQEITDSCELIDVKPEAPVEHILGDLDSLGLIVSEFNRLTPKLLGKACAVTGIRIKSALQLSKAIETGDNLQDFRRWIGLLSHLSEADEIQLPAAFYYRALNSNRSDPNGEAGKPFETIAEAKAEYFTNLLSEWSDGIGLRELEERYYLSAGLLSNIARQFSWLLFSANELAKCFNKKEISGLLREYAARVRFGVPASGLQLSQLNLFGLGRNRIMELLEAGIATFDDVGSRKAELPKSIPESIRRRLIETCEAKIKRKKMKDRRNTREDNEPAIRTLRFFPDNGQGKSRVEINGKHILITFKSYQYLTRLAESLIKTEDGWIHRLDLEDGDNQWSYLHRLRKEIESVISPSASIIENDRQGNYKLNASPEGIILSD
ncbi:MAG: DEAD/DEAH box helicase [candidate division Zixibacteria bacterium]|nr:DEAD/DEAH box helicase [candidate division Zixibacteria bacterium]